MAGRHRPRGWARRAARGWFRVWSCGRLESWKWAGDATAGAQHANAAEAGGIGKLFERSATYEVFAHVGAGCFHELLEAKGVEEIGLGYEPLHGHSGILSGGGEVREVDVRCKVLFADVAIWVFVCG